jgi:hypothetical protein
MMSIEMVQKPQNCIIQKISSNVSQTLLSLLGTRKKAFLSTSNVIILQSVHPTLAKKICTCSLSSLGQDHTLKSTIFFINFLFGLLELEILQIWGVF